MRKGFAATVREAPRRWSNAENRVIRYLDSLCCAINKVLTPSFSAFPPRSVRSVHIVELDVVDAEALALSPQTFPGTLLLPSNLTCKMLANARPFSYVSALTYGYWEADRKLYLNAHTSWSEAGRERGSQCALSALRPWR